LRVIVTGACGFIGSAVVRALVACGHHVGALDISRDYTQRIADLLDRADFLEADLADSEAVAKIAADWKPECCVHLAWYVEPGQYLNSEKNTLALASSIRLIYSLAAAGCSHFVGAGTCFEYDLNLGYLHEDSATRPETLYAASKLSLSLIGKEIAALTDMKFAWGRIFYLYGPAEDKRRVVPAVATRLLAGAEFGATAGEQLRDFSHVDDIAAGFATIASAGGEGIFNICSGIPYQMHYIMRQVAEATGRPELLKIGVVAPRAWEPPFISGDNTRLRGLGWAPQYDLDNGIRSTVDWWKAQG